ncbi:hypothetical protein [Azospirillum himalayense]|uniref:Uncharacterized protein n=1 Tax=Azospirillum himalayense TaxID=654847 RepID=A0ABW0FZS6_9PROT
MSVKTEATTLQSVKARTVCGGADWVFWNDRAGRGFAARYSVEAVKMAMLACGTAKRFYTVHRGVAAGHRWRDGCLILRNARIGC